MALRCCRFHVGTGHSEPTSDAGYTTAGFSPTAKPIDQSLLEWGESIYKGAGVNAARRRSADVGLALRSLVRRAVLVDELPLAFDQQSSLQIIVRIAPFVSRRPVAYFKVHNFFFSNNEEKAEEVYLNLVMDYIPDTLYKILRFYCKKGYPFPNAPKETFSAGVDWDVINSGDNKLTLRADAAYTGRYFFDPFGNYNLNPCDRAGAPGAVRPAGVAITCGNPGYWLENARLTFEHGNYSASLWVKNLSNKVYYTYGLNIDIFGLDYLNRGTPRTFGAEITAKF